MGPKRATSGLRDADLISAGNYKDWTAHGAASFSGYANEMWIQGGTAAIGSWGETTTTVASRAVSVHLHGDSNDGLARIWVDGVDYAIVDMYTPAGSDDAQIVVSGLPQSTHTIRVYANGQSVTGGFGYDVAIMGAVVCSDCIPTLSEWGLIATVLLLLATGTLVVRYRRAPAV